MRRATAARAREVFGVEVPVFARPELGGAAPVRRVHLWLNGDALYRILVETELGRWQVGERGRLMWVVWREDMAGPGVGVEDASRIAGEEWGAPAGAALALALRTGFDPRQLGALDLAQAFAHDARAHPWHVRAVELVAAMDSVGDDPDARVAAALARARRSGALTDEDIRVAGFPLPPSLELT